MMPHSAAVVDIKRRIRLMSANNTTVNVSITFAVRARLARHETGPHIPYLASGIIFISSHRLG